MKKHCDDLGFSYPNIFLSLFENTKLFVNCNFLRYSYDTVMVIGTVVELSSKISFRIIKKLQSNHTLIAKDNLQAIIFQFLGCNECVTWLVFKKAIKIKKDQVND